METISNHYVNHVNSHAHNVITYIYVNHAKPVFFITKFVYLSAHKEQFIIRLQINVISVQIIVILVQYRHLTVLNALMVIIFMKIHVFRYVLVFIMLIDCQRIAKLVFSHARSVYQLLSVCHVLIRTIFMKHNVCLSVLRDIMEVIHKYAYSVISQFAELVKLIRIIVQNVQLVITMILYKLTLV